MAKPSLRAQQRELTHELIFQALIDVVLEEGVHAFTVQRVAERAGVSHRTVYRHFPTREALLDAVGDWAAEHNRRGGLAPPARIQDWPEHSRRLFAGWDEHESFVRAFVLLRVAANLEPRERTGRLAGIPAMLEAFAPHASEEDRRRVLRMIPALSSTVTWNQMRNDSVITGTEAGDAVAHTMRLLLDDLKRKDRRAAAAAKKRDGEATPARGRSAKRGGA